MLAHLAEEDLQDLELLFRYRGIKTLRALVSLNRDERAVLLNKARHFYEVLGWFPSNLETSLENIFGNGDASLPRAPSHSRHGQHQWPWPLQPRSVSSDWGSNVADAGGAPCGPHSLAQASFSTSPVGAFLLVAAVSEAPDPADDDSKLKHDLKEALDKARDIIGRDRFAEVIRRLRRSDDLVSAGCLEAAEALAALGIRKEAVRDPESKQLLKAAKKVVRRVLMWRCCGNALGLDSLEALVRAFEEACRHTNCDENVVTQLTSSYRRAKEELTGGPRPKTRTAASRTRSRSRSRS